MPKLIIVGGGASALMLASEINTKKFDVEIYEANKSLGRKFLVAGDGGLNLTHSEDPDFFIGRYVPNDFIKKAFHTFDNKQLVSWLNENHIPTFVGSSHRVFPLKGIKPITVLQTFLKKIEANAVKVLYEHRLIDVEAQGELLFEHRQTSIRVKADIVVFCLGGASWSVTGSKGDWLHMFEKLQVETRPFLPSNCAFKIQWPEMFIAQHHGAVFKNCDFMSGAMKHRGEAVITNFGIEGSGIYPLSPAIRQQLQNKQAASVYVDFKPQWSANELLKKLSLLNGTNLSTGLKEKIKLSKAQIALIKLLMPKEDFLNPEKLTTFIKQVPMTIVGTANIDEAISTVGGISLNAVDENFALKNIKNYFVIGEMLDYDAPTGGYLLQSCFSMAFHLAQTLNP